MNDKPLGKKIFTAMASVVIPALLLSMITAAAFMAISSKRTLDTAEGSTSEALDIVRSAFFQNESEEYGYMLLLGMSETGENDTPNEALRTIAEVFSDYSYDSENIFFRLENGRITDAVSCEPNSGITAASVSEKLDATVNADPEGYCLFFDGVSYPDAQSLIAASSETKLYKSGVDDTALLIAEPASDDGVFYCVFREHSASSVKIEALRSMSDELSISARESDRAARVRYMAIVAAIWVLTAALLLLIMNRVTARIALPVETERNERELELRRAEDEKASMLELDRLKTEFLGNVSHELKTPLTVMSCYAQDSRDALRGGKSIETVEKNLKVITAEAERLALMVSQLLDISRIDEGKMQMDRRETEPAMLAQNTLNTYYPLFTQRGNGITFSRSGSLRPVLCDPDKIEQVLINLLTNASRHTDGGQIRVGVGEEGDFARFTVSDDGEGISPETLPHIFERYMSGDGVSGRNTGCGLGLYISKYIVEAHGGSITAESVPGTGTTVSFTIPFARKKA